MVLMNLFYLCISVSEVCQILFLGEDGELAENYLPRDII